MSLRWYIIQVPVEIDAEDDEAHEAALAELEGQLTAQAEEPDKGSPHDWRLLGWLYPIRTERPPMLDGSDIGYGYVPWDE